jgi:cytochrome c peroxidase
MRLSLIPLTVALLFATACKEENTDSGNTTAAQEDVFSTKELLGKSLYSDTSLSLNRTMSCATCHSLEGGFADVRENRVGGALSVGDDTNALGGRNAPTAGYAQFSPEFSHDSERGYFGGQFYDGRAKDLTAQAKGPFLDGAEMMMPNEAAVIERVKENSAYVSSLKTLFGSDIFDDTSKAYEAVASSIATFESSAVFAPFDSKYDRYLNGEYNLTLEEDAGMSLFFSEKNTNCAKCHMKNTVLTPKNETFTNYRYKNIGTPKNYTTLDERGLPRSTVDHGLYGREDINISSYDGAVKIPTLRNIAVTGPYMHNGVFKDLKTVIEFYDHMAGNGDRLINPETNAPWGEADVNSTINRKKLKNIALSDKKISQLIAFLNILTDKKFEHLIKE